MWVILRNYGRRYSESSSSQQMIVAGIGSNLAEGRVNARIVFHCLEYAVRWQGKHR